jgi:hypothetical protein
MDATDLREEFERQAQWRREKAAEYPEDSRNLDAAALFDQLAQSVVSLPPPVLEAFTELFDDLSDAEEWQEMPEDRKPIRKPPPVESRGE